MKKANTIFYIALFGIVLFTGCGSSSNENKAGIDQSSDKKEILSEVNQNASSVEINQSSRLKEVKIGPQVWMAENLNVDHFRNGDPIPQIKTAKDWVDAGKNNQPAWCYYGNDPANGLIYGKLYNGYAIIDPRGLAPDGWKVPSEDDFKILIDILGGWDASPFRKIKNSDGWAGNINDGYNSTGLSALPAGYRDEEGEFMNLGYGTTWWEIKEFTNDGFSINEGPHAYALISGDEPFYHGYSVRLIKE